MSNQKRSRVFIPIDTDKYDVSNAKKFGEIVYILDDTVSPFNITETTYKIINSLKRNEFDPRKDFICMTGNSIILCWASISIMTLFDKVNILLFDSRTDDYQVKTLEKPWIEGD